MVPTRPKLLIIGLTLSKFSDKRLPSMQQVLARIFHSTQSELLYRSEIFPLIYDELKTIWDLVELPIIGKTAVLSRLEKLVEDYNNKKNAYLSHSEHDLVISYPKTLENLFDISVTNVEELASQASLDFLKRQRLPGRVGDIREFVRSHPRPVQSNPLD